MAFTAKKIRTIVLWLIIIVSLPVTLSANGGMKNYLVAFEFVQPNFMVDSRENLLGQRVHFFSSRQTDYWGVYIKTYGRISTNEVHGFGYLLDVSIWQTGYWTNWEMSDQFISLDPMKTKLTGLSIGLGLSYYYNWKFLEFIPYAALQMGETSLQIEVDKKKESGGSFLIGAGVGMETHVHLASRFSLVAGYKLTYPFNTAPGYKVEQGVEIGGTFTKMINEIYLGISFELNQGY
jgi:hypothetical protein